MQAQRYTYVPHLPSLSKPRHKHHPLTQESVGDYFAPFRRQVRGTETPMMHKPSRNFPPYSKENDMQVKALLKRYQKVGRRLARGSYWDIYEAEDTQDPSNKCVLRVSNKGLLPNSYKREMEVNPNIADTTYLAKLIDIVYDQQKFVFYSVMELYKCSVLDVMENRGLSIEESLYAISSVANGLAYLNRIGYVHLDVKPDNMLVDYNGKVKLGDFGTTRRIGSNVPISETGDGRYCAPEVFRGSTSPLADVFSLGICLFEMTTKMTFPTYQFKFELDDPIITKMFPNEQIARMYVLMTNLDYSKRPLPEYLVGFSLFMSITTYGIHLDKFCVRYSDLDDSIISPPRVITSRDYRMTAQYPLCRSDYKQPNLN
ncbi:membrane-associated tyrosine- and threonine-specific CDC2-inhibitory kinase, putative [Entamoeba invadens IP1]|uniref:Membrane-associated tyrosine-and threonine-specific CDC2-inhibitory kinase, putative n=2 Tax=Entamoeba invadens TaxID=33085 RepID=A0A0A1TYT4_ENTIV|nr:membrane-associated tyrosine- and threonine-specific CDC2-inhibitory kinase, putative [Entamoeba invadens IP1]ELP84735.1 membrane-associated tyrosine- and threonine-specific CDC2-inhibitory kinase, putative [Entamoeba invadens IP1]BAN40525.1 membrane-associated tyrosine- and threonine-specific CDC2-inhibitory kinase, putative [Entamoeba invadens]BAN41514.1 membrane-associated tyrosine- and threonine-specific CDC2-inhibitory kinase, putative [Entamoeba invadens]|eukprot:XP_004184081.1 membrane-associated tyrosine- and threonine-specific CDC2-inhibitory kinase, putative [Entamoeba invadens IP1]